MTEKQKFENYIRDQVTNKGLRDFRVTWGDSAHNLSEEERYKTLNESIEAPIALCDKEVLGTRCTCPECLI